MQTKICQSCGMVIVAIRYFGTNCDGSPNTDYCCFCFQDGYFIQDMPMEEKIEYYVSFMDGTEKIEGRTFTRNEAALRLREYIQPPTLKHRKMDTIIHQEYYKTVNASIDFINRHLHEPINLYNLEDIIHISKFHFHWLFKSMLGESLDEYILRLRMEKAAFWLQASDLTLTKIGEYTGYHSSHAFIKTFKKYFGISPLVFRRYPFERKVSIPLIKKLDIQPEIREIESKEVISTSVINLVKDSRIYIRTWKKLMALWNRRRSLNWYESLYIIQDMTVDSSCISNVKKWNPQDLFNSRTIVGGLYAVFIFRGNYKDIGSIYCYIYRYWITNSDYKLRDMATFEKFLSARSVVNVDEFLIEIYIPVIQY